MTEQQEKILFEVHAKLSNGIEDRLKRIEVWLTQRPVECPVVIRRRMTRERDNRVKIVAIIASAVFGVPAFVGALWAFITKVIPLVIN